MTDNGSETKTSPFISDVFFIRDATGEILRSRDGRVRLAAWTSEGLKSSSWWAQLGKMMECGYTSTAALWFGIFSII